MVRAKSKPARARACELDDGRTDTIDDLVQLPGEVRSFRHLARQRERSDRYSHSPVIAECDSAQSRTGVLPPYGQRQLSSSLKSLGACRRLKSSDSRGSAIPRSRPPLLFDNWRLRGAYIQDEVALSVRATRALLRHPEVLN